MAVLGCAWHYMALHGTAWHCMALHGSAVAVLHKASMRLFVIFFGQCAVRLLPKNCRCAALHGDTPGLRCHRNARERRQRWQ